MTKFQTKVLTALKKIPKGKVVTYSDLARYIHSLRAVRAVGNAVGKNPDLIKVPCHRVIRSDGSIGNYVNGTKKKISLIQKEGVKILKNKIDLKKYRYTLR
jgi:methylated-DNA-[protein]-cysteine S-methyltransferase